MAIYNKYGEMRGTVRAWATQFTRLRFAIPSRRICLHVLGAWQKMRSRSTPNVHAERHLTFPQLGEFDNPPLPTTRRRRDVDRRLLVKLGYVVGHPPAHCELEEPNAAMIRP